MRLKTVSIASVLLVFVCAQVFAQWQPRLRAEIPFEFQAGGASYPAGEYSLDAISSNALLRIMAGDGSSSGAVMALPAHTIQPPNGSRLLFHRYGDRYFLAQVWVEGSTSGFELPRSRSERELAQNGTPVQMAYLPAHLR